MSRSNDFPPRIYKYEIIKMWKLEDKTIKKKKINYIMYNDELKYCIKCYHPQQPVILVADLGIIEP